MRTWVIALLLALVSVSGSCGAKGGGKPRVAVSIFPLHDVVSRIAGDRLDVVLLLPAGKSEHGYEPTPKEMARISGAKLAFLVGLGMDEWAERFVDGAARGARKIELAEHVGPIPYDYSHVGEEEAEQAGGEQHDDHAGGKDDHAGEKGDHAEKHDDHAGHAAEPAGDRAAAKPEAAHEEHGHAEGGLDPHFWLDPVRMSRAVDIIVAELSGVDPEGAAEFKKRGDELKRELATLDEKIASRAKTWSKRTIVTFHGSFGYYADRYGLRIAAVIEPFPGREPTAKYLAEVLTAIRTSGAAALFSEPQLERGPAKTVSDQAGLPLGELDPVGGTGGATSYVALLERNTDELEKHLK